MLFQKIHISLLVECPCPVHGAELMESFSILKAVVLAAHQTTRAVGQTGFHSSGKIGFIF